MLPGVSSPSAAGCRGCVGYTDLRGSRMPSTPLRLDPVSCENKNDLLPLNSALTLIRADSKCLFFCAPVTRVSLSDTSHFTSLSVPKIPTLRSHASCVLFLSSWEQSFSSSFRCKAGQMTVLSSQLKNLAL